MRATFTREDADTRRLALIEATSACLAERGVAGASVRTICARAGVSPGLLRHYFDGIDALVAATYMHVTARVSDTLNEAVAAAPADPRDRLIAYTTASFLPPIADPELLATWLAFWSLVKTDPAIAAIHTETYGGYRRDLEALLADCGLAHGEAALAAIGLTALVDGLWLELTLDPASFTADQASAMAIKWVDALVGDRPSPARHGKD